jgi:phage head maturation protease
MDSSREAFEKWLNNESGIEVKLLTNHEKRIALEAWQACEAEQRKRATIHTNNDQTLINALDTIKRLQAQIAQLC